MFVSPYSLLDVFSSYQAAEKVDMQVQTGVMLSEARLRSGARSRSTPYKKDAFSAACYTFRAAP
jgi:hypothetical protein